ncbi:MAG: hypothetical protein C7B46_03260 [Sulfobacillus benefaciens]|uniref:Rhodanese domain-containing protein n=1 Tax=Sulfobacillus benefaciens TaxID=453960 RepID=A0A2T2XKD0_9FIRM|nr:MAG: hypothetical protein C7B46_03260 [Sulfobacillus benefaciens]
MSELDIVSAREAKAFIAQGVAIIDVRSLVSYCHGHIVESISLPGGRYQLSFLTAQQGLAGHRALLIADTPTIAYEAAEELHRAHVVVVGAWVTSSEGFQHAGLRTTQVVRLNFCQLASHLKTHPDITMLDVRETDETHHMPLPWPTISAPLSTWPQGLPSLSTKHLVLSISLDPYRSLWASWALSQWGFSQVGYASEQ